jgi:cation diffusion facilitator CzcD-associated flavoprotein CzcO
MLNVPQYPDWPGLDDFEGPKFHTARWEHDHDLTGLRVAVVGTGSTAAHVVPAIAPAVGRLYVYQREPGWVVPKAVREYSQEERTRLRRSRILRRYRRAKTFLSFERLRSASRPGSKAQRRLRETCRRKPTTSTRPADFTSS